VQYDEGSVVFYPRGWRATLIWFSPLVIGVALLALVADHGWERPAAAFPLVVLALAMVPLAVHSRRRIFVALDHGTIKVSRGIGGTAFGCEVPADQVREVVCDRNSIFFVGDEGRELARTTAAMLTVEQTEALADAMGVPYRTVPFWSRSKGIKHK
jgi:hypothetical protein